MAKEQQSPREAAAEAWRQHPTAEYHSELPGVTLAGEAKAKAPEIHAADGFVTINSHGDTRVGREDLVTWRKAFEQAFQVVA